MLGLVAVVVAVAGQVVFIAVWRAALTIGAPEPVRTALRRSATFAGQLGVVLALLGTVAYGIWEQAHKGQWTWFVALVVLWGNWALTVLVSNLPSVRRLIAERSKPSRWDYRLTGVQEPAPSTPPAESSGQAG